MEKNEDITVESVDGLDRVQIPKSLIKIIVFQRKSSFHSSKIKGLAIGNQPKLAEAHNSYAK